MNQLEQRTLQRQTHYVKKFMQFLVSVSLFSFLFSCSPNYSFYLHYINYFSALSSQICQIVDKNCIFILCNGILVFLAKNSGLINSFTPESDHDRELFGKREDEMQPRKTLLEIKISAMDENAADDGALPRGKAVVREREHDYMKEEEGHRELTHSEGATLIAQDDEEYEKHTSSEEANEPTDPECSLAVEGEVVEEEEEEEEEEEQGFDLSTEELNRRFEEFIWRMKEGIRIEAERQLVMA